MKNTLKFDRNLIEKYNQTGPRYTSYPTANHFSNQFTVSDYHASIEESNSELIPRLLSLYVHIPFCDTICYYCACSKVITKNYGMAKKYLALLKQEIKMQAALFDSDRHVIQIHFGGGTPSFLNDQDIENVLQEIKSNFSIHQESEFSIEIDPRTVTPERIKIFRKLGFNRISIGVQDFNNDVQKNINRIHSVALVQTIVNACRKHKFKSINIDLMYGLPGQTALTFNETIKQVIDISPDRIALYNYAYLPEKFKPQRKINAAHLPPANIKIEIFENAVTKLVKAGYIYIGMDHFAKKDDSLVQAQESGTLQRNFQGYSTYAGSDTVAVGITAIGSIGNNYNQNVRSIDEYEALLNRGLLPIYRGFELEDDDILRQTIINQLMCYFVLDISALEQFWEIKFKYYFKSDIKALNKMTEDGLLTLSDTSLNISPSGKLLVRSIAMVFDRYIQNDDTPINYSKII